MPARALGASGLHVSAIGLGCMGLNAAEGRANSIALIRHAVDSGVTLLDTAELYGPYVNEELVGEALAPVRNEVAIITKFGAKIVDGKPAGFDSRPEKIRASADSSLLRLRTDRIDLYMQHRVDPAVPIEDVAGAVADLVTAGKVRAFGLSEAGADTIRRAHAVHPVSAVQSEYSLWTRDPEYNGVFEACEAIGAAFIAFSPLGRGFLSGAVDASTTLAANDPRSALPRFQHEALVSNAALVDIIHRQGAVMGATPAQIVIAWVLVRKPWLIPIPATSQVARITENMRAAQIRFTASDLASFEDAVARVAITGARYPESLLAMTGL
ncbi:aldo/keto reductase [Sphingobium sp. HWE2-09]|uniref:aldo/keto reductase n=1 Tax=Sphingobium sp. HWE2-09 TaxID=3108390 RepID=UPI002DCC579D|nr:aldo/keto reductase [Sphingobium sp. HWE2-09]